MIQPIRAPESTIPPLENGDRLDQKTFHERYEAMPPGTRAELIGGVVHIPSPLGIPHGRSHGWTMHWLISGERRRSMRHLWPGWLPRNRRCTLNKRLTAIIHAEDGAFVSFCPELDIASQGDSIEQARDNLREALELFFECASPTEVQQRLATDVFVTQVEVSVG